MRDIISEGTLLRKLLFLAFALSACAPTVVTEYNGDSIRIQSNSSKPPGLAVAEAQRICGTQGLKAEYASTFSHQSTLTYSHLFLCLTSTKPNLGLPQTVSGAPNYLESTATL
ncbi:MAG: hypothetical protein K0B00_11070 [Rhodobacteraceae bacterium]|nr:hypothetical protein [Paracoccaceae bacterium]